MNELSGTIKQIDDIQELKGGFKKREFVVTTDEKFPQDIKLECVKEKIEKLDGLSAGDRVDVGYNLRGNEYNGRHYVNLQAWKINKQQPASSGSDDEEEGDVPF